MRSSKTLTFETEAGLGIFAEELGRELHPGAVILLNGGLGTGKTTFVSHLARTLGSLDHVSSPTFNLVHQYQTPHYRLTHIDLYRLETAESLEQLDIDYYLNAENNITVIEWAERLARQPEDAFVLNFSILPNGSRQVALQIPEK